VRQDSGDAINFIYQAREVYQSLGIDFKEKTIVFSDALDVPRCIEINTVCNEAGFKGICTAGNRLTIPYHFH
jgi:nicotinate phosphoribosyltransferase